MKLVLPLLFLALCSFAHAETSAELLTQLKSAVKAEAKAASQDKNSTGQQRAYQLQEMLTQFGQSQEGEYSNINLIRVVDGIEATSTSESITELCQTLSKQLRAEQAQKESALIEEIQTGLASALRTWLAASTVQELDAPTVLVNQLVEKATSDRSNNSQLRLLAERGRLLSQFLRDWQDSESGFGNGEDDRRKWKDLLNSPTGFPTLIPRSEILSQMDGPNSKKWTTKERNLRAQEILVNIHSLADIPANLPQLEKLAGVRVDGEFSATLAEGLSALRSFQILLTDLEAGRSVTRNLRAVVTHTGATNEITSPLRTQLLLHMIPRLLGIADTMPSEPTENAATYLRRVALTAREKSDWTLMIRAIVLTDDLNIDPEFVSRDRRAVELFRAGMTQEQARQYEFAVYSYEAALTTGSQMVPAKFIGERLKDIREANPREFARGVETAWHSPPPFLRIVDERGVAMIQVGNVLFPMSQVQGSLVVPPAPSQPPKSLPPGTSVETTPPR